MGIEQKESGKFIINYLKGRDFTPPSEIARAWALKKDRVDSGSSWSSPKCKYLVFAGYLVRSEKGWYKLANERVGDSRYD